jgi:hypothetical protein
MYQLKETSNYLFVYLKTEIARSFNSLGSMKAVVPPRNGPITIPFTLPKYRRSAVRITTSDPSGLNVQRWYVADFRNGMPVLRNQQQIASMFRVFLFNVRGLAMRPVASATPLT